MSGTSLDGVDVSIIESDGNREFSSILDRYFKYDKELIQKILNIREKVTNSEKLNKYSNEIKELEREITLFHVEAVKDTLGMSKFPVDLIGFHGQTIFHDSEEKVTKLKELWGKGNTASQIAEIIGGISRNAVIGKAHRLNLSAKIKTRTATSNKSFESSMEENKTKFKILQTFIRIR